MKRADQVIDILAPDGKDDLAAILVTAGDIAPEEDARLLTRRAGLENCTPPSR